MSAPSTALRAGRDPYHMGHAPAAGVPEYTGHGAGGPSPKRIVVGYGFWIFLLSDIIMFSAFFATYAVLEGATGNDPAAKRLPIGNLINRVIGVGIGLALIGPIGRLMVVLEPNNARAVGLAVKRGHRCAAEPQR